MQTHIDSVLNLKLVNTDGIKESKLKVVVDGVNSTGGIIVPLLLKQLNIEFETIHCEPTGHFAHNPEPLTENLYEISKKVVESQSDFGIVVDPDVDRLAFVCEDGDIFGEENTLVACSDYVLSKTPGSTVSNLSSTRALLDVTLIHAGHYSASAVGEVNVVKEMKAVNAVIGGEGNGGVIYPPLHYGRDALVGVVIFLSLLERTVREVRDSYPNYFISKNKIQLTPEINVDKILSDLEDKYKKEKTTNIDGLKIDFKEGWVHLRKSNTEPIIRIYSEAKTKDTATNLIKEIET